MLESSFKVMNRNDKKMEDSSLDNFYGIMRVGFCLNIGKHLIEEVSF